MRQPGGFALVIVLWTMVLLALIATQITGTGRFEARLASNLRGAASAQAGADGAVHEAIFRLLAEPGRPWPPDPSPQSSQRSGIRTTLRLGSEDGRFDLNSAAPEVLAALLRALGADRNQAQALAADIVLWRFPSAQATARMRAYQQAGLTYGPPGAPYQTSAELALVLGMTPALFERLRPHVTVFHEGTPDPAAAGPLVRGVLVSLGMASASGTGAAETTRGRGGTRIVVIDAEAEADGGSRASRHAVVRIGSAADRGGWGILVWE